MKDRLTTETQGHRDILSSLCFWVFVVKVLENKEEDHANTH